MSGVDLSSASLLERASELAQLDEALLAVAADQPRVVLFEGPAGIGKTALLQFARGRAEAAGFLVLAARGGELERDLGMGIVRQLFESLLVRADAAQHEVLLARPAALLGRIFGLDASEPDRGADEYSTQNALYWLCVRLAERGPIMLAIDDLHWSDATSLRWLVYLVRRLEDLPVLLVLARRIDEPGPNEELMAGLSIEPVVQAIRPEPLTLSAVRELARSRFETSPEATFVDACYRAAGGNPLFTLQLLDAARAAGLRPVDIDAEAVAGLAPERVSQLVLERLRRLSAATINVARQVALLGTRAEVRHVSVLSALTEPQVLAAADELAAAGLLRDAQPLEFIHPVIRSSVYLSMGPGRRADGHRRAARLLGQEGAPPATVAVHLLKTPAAGDAWTVEVLRAAAAAEIRPEMRATFLRRAIGEPASLGILAEVLAELGHAESLTFDVRALEHLREALRLGQDSRFRAKVAGQLAYCYIDHDLPGEAEPVLRTAIEEHQGAMFRTPASTGTAPGLGGGEREPLVALHVGLLQIDHRALRMTPQRLSEAVAMAGEGGSPAELDLLGFAAYAAPSAGATAAETIALAERSLGAVDLGNTDGFKLIHCPVWALEFADRLDEADRWLLRILDSAQRNDGPGQFLLAASARAQVSCRRGALADAEQDARAVLELAGAHGGHYSIPISVASLVLALTEQGRLDEASDALGSFAVTNGAQCDLAVYVHSRGWLRLAQGRTAEAAEDFAEAGRLTREAAHDFPGFWPWRIGAATAQLDLGQREAASVLAREQLDFVRHFAAPGPTGVALRTLGLAERGDAGLALLAAACAELNRSPAMLDRAKSQLEYGAALRRAGKRAEACEALRRALDLADRCGAVPVAERSREELLAAGGRPRRTRLTGVGALTACELRVARRAADGRTNREIAQELFVTMKAVEKHLGSAYRKLDIERRHELAGALGTAKG